MAVCDFLKRYPKNKFTPLFINHNTDTSRRAYDFLTDYFKNKIVVKRISAHKPKGKSWEHFWRDERLKVFRSMGKPVITAHHLDDVAETLLEWFGRDLTTRTPQYFNGVVYRPFLITPKENMVHWCEANGVPWIEDQSNKNIAFKRNLVRHNIIPQVLNLNIGFKTVVRKMLLEKYKDIAYNTLSEKPND